MASSKYWKDREKMWQTDCQKQNTNWQKEINDVYQTMSDEINDQVLIFYQKYADENGLTLAQAKQYLDQTDIRYYANLAKRYCEDAARDMDAGTWEHSPAKSYFTKQADEEMSRYNTAMKIARLDMLKRQIDLRIANAQRKVCSVVHDALTDRALQTYTRQAGILGKTVLNNLAHVQTIVQASFHGTNFSNRIWGTQQDKLKKFLRKSLQDCLILGKGAAPFVRELKKATGKTARQAQTLMSTELARVQVQAALDSMKASGFDEFQVIASSDCCDECQKIDGQHYPIPKLASGENAPPMHPNCRCSIAPYEARNEDSDKDFDEAAFDEWCDYMEEHEDDEDALTWEEWKAQKNSQKDTGQKRAEVQGPEKESSKPKKDAKTQIARSVINSSKYRKAFDDLGESPKVTRAMYQASKNILEHRTETLFEDLAFINSETGETLIRDDINEKQRVYPSKKMKEMVEANPNKIIAIHNHPNSSLPSQSDIWNARRYKYGLIAAHDGNVIKYEVSDKLKNEDLVYIDNLMGDLERNSRKGNPDEREKLLRNLATVGVKLSWINKA